jgi:thiol-disulfide isomerase/thioredoxin
MLQTPSSAQSSWEGVKGKVVVLEFWATWCGPCIAAIPHLNELADKFQDGSVQFIAVTDEDEKIVGPFLRKKPMRAWIGLDTDKSMFKDYGIRGIPHTVVVDQNGIVAAVTYPTSLKEEHLKDLLAGRKISFAQPGTQERVPSDRVSAIPTPDRESLFQVVIRPSEGGPTSSSSSRGSLKQSGATVLDVLSSSYNINPARIVTNSALPEGQFDVIIKTPDTGNGEVQALLRQAVEWAFGVTTRHESREMDVFVLKSGQPTEHLAPTMKAVDLLVVTVANRHASLSDQHVGK